MVAIYFMKKKQGDNPEDKDTAIMLLDLETQEKKQFLSGSASGRDIDEDGWSYVYRFSQDGSSLLGFIVGGAVVKVWSLPDMEERVIPVTEGRSIFQVGFLEDGKLIIVELEKGMLEVMLPLQKEISRTVYGKMEETASAHIFEYYNEAYPLDYFIRAVDPFTSYQSERVFHNFLSASACSIMDTALNQVLQVREDGALIATSVTEDEEPVEMFGAVKGFTLSTNPIEIAKQCVFLSESLNILKSQEEEGFIVRDLEKGKEFFCRQSF